MDEKEVRESCGHGLLLKSHPCPFLAPFSASFSALTFSVSGSRWFVLQTRHICSARGGGCGLHRELLLPGLSARAFQLGTLGGGCRPDPGPQCGCQDEHPLLSCSHSSFHLAIVRCEGHRTEIVGKPGELGAGRWGEEVGRNQNSKPRPYTHCSVAAHQFSLFSPAREPVCSCFAWLYPGRIC